MDAFQQFLAQKKVAIVAPSQSLYRQKSGSIIDQYDVVVRINNSFELMQVAPEYYGTRCDVNYINGLKYSLLPNIWCEKKIKYICAAYPKEVDFMLNTPLQSFTAHPVRWYDLDFYNTLCQRIGYRPLSGTCTLADIMRYKVKEVRLFGLDFYRTGYDSRYIGYHFCELKDLKGYLQLLDPDYPHNFDADYLYFKKYLYPDKRVVVDDFFKKILEEGGDDE